MLNFIQKASRLIKNAESIFVITGAGISADSGLPTYRGIGGLYENQFTEDGIEIEEALSIDIFSRNPQLSWKYLSQLGKSIVGKKFNFAHEFLAQLEQQKKRFLILTQNVDGFHLDAGNKNVIEIHGNLHYLICLYCNNRIEIKNYYNLEIPPRCNQCGNIMKPDVVLFGEVLPNEKVFQLEKELSINFDLLLVIGTSAVFPYISEPVIQYIRKKIPVIEINPVQTILSRYVNLYIPERAANAMKQISEFIKTG